jgi:secretion/DNA translocation related TadE-like protein
MMAAIMSVVIALGAAATVVAGYLVSHHQARSAADLAALSGAAAFSRGDDACTQARRTARANGARATRCNQVGDEVDFVVTVRVVVEVRVRSPGLPRRVEAEAHAGRVG